MRENRIRTIWRDGGAVVNGWLGIPSSISAETMAHQGWDSLLVDQQHGMIDFQSAVTMFQAISTTDTVPLTRVPWLEPGIIMKSLDAGAYGVICPMVNTRADAETLVGACRYAPDGNRSFGPMRALMYAGADYPQHANETVLAIAMIETRQALDNLDEILSVPGLDGVYIGPFDLGLSLGGQPKPDQTDATMMAAIERVLAASKEHGVVPGIHCGAPAYAAQMVRLGFQLVTVQTDNGLLAQAARRVVGELRDDLANHPRSD
ncbi:MAG: HpcH/HpaI aldolase/citrate lyase family protein [Kiloniellaceae bacterium]